MINLLPSQEKEVLAQEENWKLILVLGIIFLASVLSLSLILFSIKIYTSNQTEIQKSALLQKEKELNTPQNRDLERKSAFLNQKLAMLDSFYKREVSLTDLLDKISKMMPDGMFFTSFSYTSASAPNPDFLGNIVISGFAADREILFKFKEKIEEEKNFKDIDFPLSNLVSPVNINFSLGFKVVSQP